MIRILIVDDDALVRVGLSMVLGADETSRSWPRRPMVPRPSTWPGGCTPDVVLMDIRMSGMDGLAATEALRSSGGPAVIVLTTFDTDEHILRALRVGCQRVPPQRHPAAGDPRLGPARGRGRVDAVPDGLARLIDHVVRNDEQGERPARVEQARAALNRLTEREREVAVAIGEGRSNAEISGELYMSIATVKAYVSRILTEVGLRQPGAGGDPRPRVPRLTVRLIGRMRGRAGRRGTTRHGLSAIRPGGTRSARRRRMTPPRRRRRCSSQQRPRSRRSYRRRRSCAAP